MKKLIVGGQIKPSTKNAIKMQYYKPSHATKTKAEPVERYTSEDADEFLLTNGKFVKGGLNKLLYRRHSIDGSRKNLNKNQQRRSIMKKEADTYANSLLNRARDSMNRGKPRNSVQFITTTHGDSSLNQNTSEGSPDNTRAVFRGISNPFRMKNLMSKNKFSKFNARRKSIMNGSDSERNGSVSKAGVSPSNFARSGVIKLRPILGRNSSLLKEEEPPGSNRMSHHELPELPPKRRDNLVREIDTGAGMRLVLDKISDKSSENSEISKTLAAKEFGRLDSKKRSQSFNSANQNELEDLKPIQKLISDFAVFQKVLAPSSFSPKARNLPPRHFATPTPVLSATTKHRNKENKFFNPYTISELPGSMQQIPVSGKSPAKGSSNFREMVRDSEAAAPSLKDIRLIRADPMDALKQELKKAGRARDEARLKFLPAYRRTEHGFTVHERYDLNYSKPVAMISPRAEGSPQKASRFGMSPRKRGKKELQFVRHSGEAKPSFFRVLDSKQKRLADSTDLFKQDLKDLRHSLGADPTQNPYFESKREEFLHMKTPNSQI